MYFAASGVINDDDDDDDKNTDLVSEHVKVQCKLQ